MDPFLKTGITLAVFKLDGKIPVVNERLMIFERGPEISFLTEDRMWGGMLKGPEDLFRFREVIQSVISTESVGDRKIVLLTGFFRKVEKCLLEYGIWSLMVSATEEK